MNILQVYTSEEIKKIILLLKNEFEALFDRVNLDSYCKKLSDKGNVVALYENDEIIGIAAMYINDNINMNAYITLIGVSSKFQRGGYGSELLQYCIKKAVSVGMKYLRLEVDNDNKNAIRFYYKNGFEFECYSDRNSSYFVKYIGQ